jgi:phytoene synthase
VPPDVWQVCEAIAREHGKTFAFASRFLPEERRRGVLATYAFCRTADDIVDAAPGEGLDVAADLLDRWEAQLDTPDHPVTLAFLATRQRYAVPQQPARDLIAGVRSDLTPRRYTIWEDLRSYCFLVAGTVGLMVAPVLGCRDSAALDAAAELGIAMQLTNILRDVGEDARAGRLYLPLDEIAGFGCDPEAIMAGRPGSKFPALMAFQVARARELYALASRGLPALPPRSRFTTLAAGRLYARILDEIERQEYDVFRMRAHVSAGRKARALPGLAIAFGLASLSPGVGQPSSALETAPQIPIGGSWRYESHP